MFIASHAIGQGAVIWVFISEIFPNKVRAAGQSWGTGVHWVFAAIITLVTPIFLDSESGIFKDNPWPIFIFFAFMMVLQLGFVKFMMPETKGVELEELSKRLSK
jgi:MFS family permease